MNTRSSEDLNANQSVVCTAFILAIVFSAPLFSERTKVCADTRAPNQNVQKSEQTNQVQRNDPEIVYDSASTLKDPLAWARRIVLVVNGDHTIESDVYQTLRGIAEKHSTNKKLSIYAFSNRSDANREVGSLSNPNNGVICRLTKETIFGPDEDAPPPATSAGNDGRVAMYVRDVGQEEEEVFLFWRPGEPKSHKSVIKQNLPPYTGKLDADLVIAAFRGDENRVEGMLIIGVDPNRRNEGGETALVTAVSRRDSSVVRTLLAHAADPNLPTNRGDTALRTAILLRDEQTVALLLVRGADPNTGNQFFGPPLEDAVAHATSRIVRQLISAGARVDAIAPWGGTALMTACERLSISVLKEVLAAGADPNIALIKDGRTALMLCYYHSEAITLLVEAGADANAKAKDGTTALMLAAQYGPPDAVRTLINVGADVNARNSRGQSVLALAIKDGDEESQRLLQEAGALR